MKDSIIRFNDKALDDVIQSSASKFANFQLYLNNLSSDIKNLEKWLQACSVCVSTSVEIKLEEEKHYISWSSRNGDWRLLYESPIDPDFSETGSQFETLPLIETPVYVRLRCAPFLPKLVAELASLLPTAEKDEPKMEAVATTTARARIANPVEDLDAIFSSEDEIPF